VAYRLVVSDDKFEWALWKRYNEFLDLHQQLSKKYKGLPPFPPRRFKILIDDDFIEERKQGLIAYFSGLDDELFEESEELRTFLGVYNDKKTRMILKYNN